MVYNSEIHNRQSLRLKDYDYSKNGLYFITISIQNKLCLFGEIKDNELNTFSSGLMVKNEWKNLENKYKNIKLHDFVIMPNHFHGIIEILDDVNNDKNIIMGTDYLVQGTHKGHPYDENRKNIPVVGAIPCGCPKKYNICPENDFPKTKNAIGDIIGGFKSITTNEYIKNVENNKWLPFNKKLWQRNYYEHIIRNEESYNKIVEYIQNNPKKWDEDKFYFTEF